MRNLSFLLLFVLPFLSCTKKEGGTEPEQESSTEIPQLDKLAHDFMTKYKVPGLQLAIAKQGKLIYAKSYGKADVSKDEDVTNNNLFRVASVSKPITGVAIMKLAETGKLSLNDKVFGAGSILGNSYGNVSAAVASITVGQLLHHTSGGWGNSASDPMFLHPQMSAEQLITWTLANRPLTSTPGTKYDYSNFGYCVLGRVIEKVTGQTYEQYVKTAVFQPSGAPNISIGGNQLNDRKNMEVVYYGQNGENPYLYNISRMDAHGGWIASATDLLRFMVKVDGFNSTPDLLTAQSIAQMTTGSVPNSGYGYGWSVNSAGNWWHTGSLPGTTSEIVRTSGGYCWAILCNTRVNSGAFNQELDELIWKVVNDNSVRWPVKDLF